MVRLFCTVYYIYIYPNPNQRRSPPPKKTESYLPGCFNWMIPNHYIKKWLSISNWLAALEFQVKKYESPCHHLKINSEKSGKLTCPLKINGWNMHFILKWSLFRGRIRKFSGVSLRGICHICLPC